MKRLIGRLIGSQQSGLIGVVIAIGIILSVFSGHHMDRRVGAEVNNFLNSATLIQIATDTSFFAIMAVGATIVIISGGIDLSVGSIYALAGVTMALLLRHLEGASPVVVIVLGAAVCLGVGLVCGWLNGLMVVGLRVHPFIITLGTMWIFRGIAFVSSHAASILLPAPIMSLIKAGLGLSEALHPVPLVVMILVAIVGAVFLGKTVMGRNIYAIGGNIDASRYSGIPIGRTLMGVYAISGLCAGLAAFVGSGYYGSATCSDASGYELYVVASAVVGGASLSGGKGSAVSAALGALLIILFRQAISSLHWDQNYQWIIIGSAIIVAVLLDRLNADRAAKRLSGGAGGLRR